MPVSSQEDNAFPSFDARSFEPPSWATDTFHRFPKSKGQPSRTTVEEPEFDQPDPNTVTNEVENDDIDTALDLGIEQTSDGDRFTVSELQKMLAKATSLKEEGNRHFTSSPPQFEDAQNSYLAALDYLPTIPQRPHHTVKPDDHSGIQEITEDEALQIEAEKLRDHDRSRDVVESEIRQCTKAVWGNLGAVYFSMGNDKETVQACTKALELDSHYVKALQRRGSASERIGSWSSLTMAQEDYTLLLTLLPKNSPQIPLIRRSLASLPSRISLQQEKEKDEMLSKLKDLGNSVLGKFGLSTDMFKFDQQPGGGYNLRFGS